MYCNVIKDIVLLENLIFYYFLYYFILSDFISRPRLVIYF